jgi:endonuclease/exonuclease/phosphatase family metal-dependent hydrolase
MKRCVAIGCGLIMALSCLSFSKAKAEVASTDIRVMSFNIRYGTAPDGDNHWERRKDFLAETIRASAPDLLGTQETLGFQRDYLAQQFPEYENLGVGRVDGGSDGEMTALFYRRDRFEKLDGGHFWLSETPSEVGSISWDSSLPRMVTWVKLRDLREADEPAIFFFNTHFDHRGVVARSESARLLRRKVEELAGDGRAIVTGDFNADEGSEPYRVLFGVIEESESPLFDSYRVVHETREKNEGTFSAFKAGDSFGPRIDWIGLSRDWKVLDANIDRTSKDGVTPSDHFPVTTIISSSASEATVAD